MPSLWYFCVFVGLQSYLVLGLYIYISICFQFSERSNHCCFNNSTLKLLQLRTMTLSRVCFHAWPTTELTFSRIWAFCIPSVSIFTLLIVSLGSALALLCQKLEVWKTVKKGKRLCALIRTRVFMQHNYSSLTE